MERVKSNAMVGICAKVCDEGKDAARSLKSIVAPRHQNTSILIRVNYQPQDLMPKINCD
jgi:hypothetical protein